MGSCSVCSGWYWAKHTDLGLDPVPFVLADIELNTLTWDWNLFRLFWLILSWLVSPGPPAPPPPPATPDTTRMIISPGRGIKLGTVSWPCQPLCHLLQIIQLPSFQISVWCSNKSYGAARFGSGSAKLVSRFWNIICRTGREEEGILWTRHTVHILVV